MSTSISRRQVLLTSISATLAGPAVLGRGGGLLARAVASADEATVKAWTAQQRVLPAVAVTGGPRQHFFGYYDKQQFDPTGRYLLGLECDVIGRLQRPEDAATIGIVDLQRDHAWTPLAQTRAWNWQMGCHLEWLPGEARTIVYNDRRDGRLVAVVRNLDQQSERVLPRPIFSVAPDGTWGLSLNFARLWRWRPETGFCGVADPWADEVAPVEDGLFRVNLASGKSRLIVSHKDMAGFRPTTGEGAAWYFTHPAINEDGTRILFWYRMAARRGSYQSCVYTADAEGGKVHLVAKGNSHTVWLGREEILAWLNKGPQGAHFYLYHDGSNEVQIVGGDVLNVNGHAVYSPDRKWLLADRPPNKANERALVIADLERRQCYEIGRFATMPGLTGELRCDLHARWNRDGTAVCFDSTHEGSRQMYWIDVSRLARPAGAGNAGVRYLPLLQSHFDKVIAGGTDVYGDDRSGLWLASVDIHKGGQPSQPDPAVKRTYRQIHAPRGSNLYWDQPALVAAYNLSRLTGDDRYRGAADRYLRDFLQRCVSPSNGLFLWGNHVYYDVFTDKIVTFSGGHHEARPLPCAWDLFWSVSPERTERCIRAMGAMHVVDPATGMFDRHASTTDAVPPARPRGQPHPFLEAGGVLIESLAWLSAKTGHKDPWLKDRALLVARYSFEHRGAQTGLLQNQTAVKRWDYYASTTEVGLWACCLLRSAEYTGVAEFNRMARDAVAGYLRYGFDAKTGRYFGQLNVSDGSPRKPQRTKTTGEQSIYQPGEFAELWEPLFPTHNYPMSMAEACLTLYQQTRDEQFRQAVARWANFIAQSTPANGGKGAYADQYGRCIHFLLRAAQLLDDRKFHEQAQALAAEAVAHLYSKQASMFRSHPGEDRADAVDGIGILFNALIYLETGREPELMGFGF